MDAVAQLFVPEENPSLLTWAILLAVTAGAAAVGVHFYVKSKAPEPPAVPTPLEAVRSAIRLLGEKEDPVELADVAYAAAYPSCPPVLDPNNPAHADCIGKWLGLRDLAIQEVAHMEKPKPSVKIPKQPGEAEAAPSGAAADVNAWILSLSQGQRASVRSIIGANYYDPIQQAASAGKNADTIAALIRFRRDAQQYASEQPIQAYKQYKSLKELLGPKIDELLKITQRYQ